MEFLLSALRSDSRFPFQSSVPLRIRMKVRLKDAPHGFAVRNVEPDDRVHLVDHERAELAVVIAVDDPALRRSGERLAHPLLQQVGGCLRPVCVMVKRVQFDKWDAEDRGEPAGSRRLP